MTFTILGKSEQSSGIGVISGSIAVRRRVPWIEENAGCIATQAITETRYGREGIALLKKGLSPQKILKKITKEDQKSEERQVAILSASGEKAIHTGDRCPEEKDSKKGRHCIAIGNMLENVETVKNMIGTFEEKSGVLSSRILKALEAGSKSGGDLRGNRTAALLAKGRENIDIGVDSSKDPLQELKRRFEIQSK